MGVTGLWTVVQPCARPIKLETLNKKRLAVDASIWIYQFLKAVRDKEGNALRNSHVVGFFRRICKLLFFGIKPVFVFDGGAPVLKRQTVSARKSKREGRREDAVRTAGKLLALQMQRRAEEEDRKRRDERDRPTAEQEEEEVPDDLVYVDELQMTVQERQQNRQFKKKDAYHLPQLDVSLEEMGAPNDPRIMSHEELEEYARQFHTGEDVNVYDFSKIDFNSPFFLSLPASDRYNILNAARLRSRLRMGHSKEQLDTMFPDRMAFSRFQIQRVSERNELTQRLMNINGMNGEDAMFGVNGGGRVAGEKGREYVLVKNDGVEGGWALGVVSNNGEGERNKPIDVEGFGKEDLTQEAEGDGSEEEGFEDVPIEGLNRLPKRSAAGISALGYSDGSNSMDIMERRRALYEAREAGAGIGSPSNVNAVTDEPDSLFVPQVSNGIVGQDNEETNDLFEDIPPANADVNDDLSRAIAMSLEQPEEEEQGDLADMSVTAVSSKYKVPNIDRPLEFNQKNAKAGRDFAHQTNARAHGVAPKPFFEDSDDEDDLRLQASLEESRRTMHKPQGPQGLSLRALSPRSTSPSRTAPKQKTGFDGPLPFESINFGNSILGRKKTKFGVEEEGGFEKQPSQKEKPPQPLPPWFSKDVLEAKVSQKAFENKDIDGGDPSSRAKMIESQRILRRQETGEVIDLDAPVKEVDDVVEVASSSGEGGDVIIEDVIPIDAEMRMGDIADQLRAEPPKSGLADSDAQPLQDTRGRIPPKTVSADSRQNSEEPIEWEESDLENDRTEHDTVPDAEQPVGGRLQPSLSESPSPEFADGKKIASPSRSHHDATSHKSPGQTPPHLPQALSLDLPAEDSDVYSDPEDEDLMRQLAAEASEHARFASTLSSTSHLHSAQDYETELRQLRNQQKKDRRDADEVSHIMITECQQLLKLFGLPYITAPMEAEAQCAELVNLGLVDGIVTDDSDIFLFGGTRVYKNMFNQAKFVECYLSSDLEKEYSLDRHALIRIAHLLGSDYTEGLPSVGPVTALEILSEFPSLEAFAEWWSAIQLNPKLSLEDAAIPFRRKFRKNASKLFLPTIFPDTRVDEAYLHPEVDKDTSPFQWGVPDLDALRQFLMATIGWSQERTDEVLVPVIKDMNRRENEGTQANITQFFGGGVGGGVGVGARQNGAKGSTGSGNAGGGQFAPRRRVEGKSKRMESALSRLHAQATNRTIDDGEAPPHDDDPNRAEDLDDTTGNQYNRGKRKSPSRESPSSNSAGEEEDEVPRKGRKRGRGTGRGGGRGKRRKA